MTEIVPADRSAELAQREAAINAQLTVWFEAIPNAGEDGGLGILEQILAATSLEDLDRPWASGGLGEWTGWCVEVRSLRKMESDFPGGSGWFMLIDAVVVETGEAITLSTGSSNVMAQLLVANHLGVLPARFVPRVAEEPTANGFYPQHLQVYKPSLPLAPGASEQLRAAAKRTEAPGEAAKRARARMEEQRAAKAEPKSFDVPDEPGF